MFENAVLLVPTGVHTCELLLALFVSLSQCLPPEFSGRRLGSALAPGKGGGKPQGLTSKFINLGVRVETQLRCPHKSVAPGKGFLATLTMGNSGAYSGGRGISLGGVPCTPAYMRPAQRPLTGWGV